MEAQLMEREQARAIAQQRNTGATPADLIRYAMESKADVSQLRELMALQREWEAHEAKKLYDASMAEFKKAPPEILKRKQVSFQTSKGVTEYKHAELGDVCNAIIVSMAAHGITHRWNTLQPDGQVEVTCTLTHVAGHSETTTLKAKPDDSGGKNAIQAVMSAQSYLQRYTLLSAAGMATNSMQDDDGRGAGKAPSVLMTEDHAATVHAKCEEISKTMLPRVLKSYKVAALSELPDSEYEIIIKRLAVNQAETGASK